jgi:Lrp/AsnC family transcriptional regulator
MTDLAIQLPEANRRLDAIDRKILTVLQEDASLSVAEIEGPGRVVVDAVLEADPAAGGRRRDPAPGGVVDQNKIGLGISVFVSVEAPIIRKPG